MAIISHMDSIADSLECIAIKVNGALAWGHHWEYKAIEPFFFLKEEAREEKEKKPANRTKIANPN